jgi:drug/metabolite transporter (DMT)-like permease
LASSPFFGAFVAIGWAVASALLFALSNVALRMVPQAEASSIALIRSVVFAIALAPFFSMRGASEPRASTLDTGVAFGLFTVTTIVTAVTWFLGLQALPLATATSLFSLKAAFAMLGAALLLGERLSARRFAALCIGFAGGAVLLEPGAPSIPGAMWVLCAAVSASLNGIFYARLVRAMQPTRVLLISSLLQFLMLAPFALIDTAHLPLPSLFIACVSTVLSIGVMYTLAWAYRGADVGLVALLEYLRLPFAAILAYLFFAERPTTAFYIGSAIIVASMLLAKPLQNTHGSGGWLRPLHITSWRPR